MNNSDSKAYKPPQSLRLRVFWFHALYLTLKIHTITFFKIGNSSSPLFEALQDQLTPTHPKNLCQHTKRAIK